MATSNLYIAPEDGWVDCNITDAGSIEIRAFPHRPFYVSGDNNPDLDANTGFFVHAGGKFKINTYVAGPVYVRVLDNAQPEPGQKIRIDIDYENFNTVVAQVNGLPASLGPKAPEDSTSVTPAGLEYETVAASQTAQVLGSTGAAGDYLSHVILQPTTTGAGTMTILDNATVIFTFTTGTLLNLAPIVIPIGAFSQSGAWKITTGANETVTAFGNFT